MALSQLTVTALSTVANIGDSIRRQNEELRTAVEQARREGASWDSIGMMLCVTGEAARQRFGPKVAKRRTKPESLF